MAKIRAKKKSIAKFHGPRIFIIAGCLMLAILVRLSNFRFVFDDVTGHLNFIDTDCYYYLRRIAHFLGNFPSLMTLDPLIDWPQGGTISWPELFVLIIGVPLKVLGVSHYFGLELGACVVMVALGIGLCFLIYWTAVQILPTEDIRLMVLAIACLNFLLTRFSCLGQVDHHIMEAFFPVLMLYLGTQLHRPLVPFAAGICLALSFEISSSSFFTFFAFLGAYGIFWGPKHSKDVFFKLSASFFLMMVIQVTWTWWSRGHLFSWFMPSLLHLFFTLPIFGSVGLKCHGSLEPRIRKVAFVLILALPFLSLLHPTVGIYVRSAFGYVFGHEGILQNVTEAKPLFLSNDGFDPFFMHSNFGFLVYLLPLAWIGLFRSQKMNSSQRALLLFVLILSISGLAQKRFAHLLIGPYLIFLGLALEFVREQLIKGQRMPLFLPLCIVFFVLQAVPVARVGFSPRGSPRDRVDLAISKEFLKSADISQAAAWDRLTGKTPGTEGIWVNLNMGHMILYLTGFGVVSNSFYSPYGMRKDFELRKLKSIADLRTQLDDLKIRYSILVDDFRFFDLQFRLRNEPTPFVKNTKRGSGYSLPVLQEFSWVRLLKSDDDAEGLKRLFTIQTNEPHYYNFATGLDWRASGNSPQ